MSLNVEVMEVPLGWGSFQDTTLYQVQPGTTLRYALHTLYKSSSNNIYLILGMLFLYIENVTQ